MSKRILIAIIAVFVSWSILDFIIHGILLQPIYEATAELWRPMNEIKFFFAYAITFTSNVFFVLMYSNFVSDKSLTSGVKFGVFFGMSAGIMMGLGSYPYMPIPLTLAVCWFAACMLQSIVAGAISGSVLKS